MRNIVLLLIFSIFMQCESKEDGINFDEREFNNILIDNPSFGIGYNFYINNEKYFDEKTFTYPINTLKLRDFLTNRDDEIYFQKFDLAWRSVDPPFYFSKKRNADSLIIIKNGKKFIFVRSNWR